MTRPAVMAWCVSTPSHSSVRRKFRRVVRVVVVAMFRAAIDEQARLAVAATAFLMGISSELDRKNSHTEGFWTSCVTREGGSWLG